MNFEDAHASIQKIIDALRIGAWLMSLWGQKTAWALHRRMSVSGARYLQIETSSVSP